MPSLVYELRVVGEMTDAERETFADLTVTRQPHTTVISGLMDQAALHGVIERVRMLGLELLDIKRVPSGGTS